MIGGSAKAADTGLHTTALQRSAFDEAIEALDRFQRDFLHSVDASAFSAFGGLLSRLKRQMHLTQWVALKAECTTHPIASILHQDPLTYWSYQQPRGYPGDARLLDFIYNHPSVAGEISRASEIGRAIYFLTCARGAPEAVRERRKILRNLVNDTADKSRSPIEVFAIAAGHLRESEDCAALQNHKVARWVALDQDVETIASLSAHRLSAVVNPIVGSVLDLLRKKPTTLGQFDLVYSAGLYDYLSDPIATRLTTIRTG